MSSENKEIKEPKGNKPNKSNSAKGSKKYFKARKDSFQEIAVDRIKTLFLEAEKMFNEDKILANKYVSLARKIAMKHKVSFTKEQKTRFCKNCGTFLVQGRNARIRLSKGNMVIKCENCKSIRRLKFK